MKLFRKRNPETPKLPFMKSAVIALLRHLLTFIGGTLVAKGIIDTATLTEIIGAIITLLSVGWMAVEKVKGKPEAPKA
jgi:hypothetical protein